jgi:hypothetical protein
LQLQIAKEVLLRLESARDHRSLAPHELALWQLAKHRSLVLSSLLCTVTHQESRVLCLHEGYAPTKNFHVYANAWCHKNFIQSVNIGDQVVGSEPQKAQAFFDFYDDFMGEPAPRSCAIDHDRLDLPRLDLSPLSEHFTEEDVWNVVRSLSPDKAPGLDGFSTRFLQAAWLLTKGDTMWAFDAFWYVDTRHFHSANDALMTLLPKTPEAAMVKDFPPNLTHSCDWKTSV